jgi:hypothetical protein
LALDGFVLIGEALVCLLELTVLIGEVFVCLLLSFKLVLGCVLGICGWPLLIFKVALEAWFMVWIVESPLVSAVFSVWSFWF